MIGRRNPFRLSLLSLLMPAFLRTHIDDTTNPGPPTPSPAPPAPREPETFSKDYVRELREESKGYRLKLSETEAKAKAAEEKAAAAVAAIAKAKTEAQTAADQRVIRAELKAVAIKAGMVDLDGLKLADLSTVKVNPETGDVEGGEELIEALKKAKPYLFGAASTSSTSKAPPSNPPAAKKASEMTPEEYQAAKAHLLGR